LFGGTAGTAPAGKMQFPSVLSRANCIPIRAGYRNDMWKFNTASLIWTWYNSFAWIIQIEPHERHCAGSGAPRISMPPQDAIME
jgi:hypothetical protein